MAEHRRKLPVGPGGKLKDATLVPIEESQEKSSTYRLADGSEITLRIVVTEIWRFDGEYDQEGNPAYLIKSGNMATVHAPETLRRKES